MNSGDKAAVIGFSAFFGLLAVIAIVIGANALYETYQEHSQPIPKITGTVECKVIQD